MQPWCQPYADRRRPANDQNRNPYAFSYDGNSVRRRNSTGHKLGDGIKRRLTILRRRIE